MRVLLRTLILFLAVILVLPGCFNGPGKKGPDVSNELMLEDIWKTADYELESSTEQVVNAYLEEHFRSGFMPLYRKVYYKLYASETAPFEKKFAAASAILLASHNLVSEAQSRNSGKRLFLLFCQKVLVDGEFAIKMSQLNRKHQLFSEDKHLEALWQAFVREVWGRVYKPEVMKKFDCDEKTQAFLDEFPDFKSEVESLISFNKGSVKEERYEFFLKEGKTGVNESDYELRRAAD